jgi:hypothetical protein
MINTEPMLSTELQTIADRVFLLRGKAIGAYAQIEFQLAEICLRAWQTSAYKNLVGPFPFKVSDRVQEMSRLLNSTGPLAQHRREIEPLLTQLAAFENHRHLFAHAHLLLTNSNGVPGIHFRIYSSARNKYELQGVNWTFDEMEAATRTLTDYAGVFGRALALCEQSLAK